MEKPPHKAEFPPLLPQGFHAHSPEAVRQLCVDGFPDSPVRAEIWAGLATILERIAAVNITCEVWLNGSFTTQKPEPDDVDFILIAASHYRSAGTQEQQDLIEWLINREDEPKTAFKCHTDCVLEFPEGSPFYGLFEDDKAHWEELYGFSVTTHEPKGIVVLKFEEKQPKKEPDEGSGK